MRELTVATVQVGNYLGRGAEYVTKLFNGVRRHMPKDVRLRCVCLTDDPSTLPADVQPLPAAHDPASWWHKISLFHPGYFKPGEHILYLDLDSIVVGDLKDIAAYVGPFALLRDVYHPRHMQSSVMAWQAGRRNEIWTQWVAAGKPETPRGDQGWIEFVTKRADFWQEIVPGQLVSFKKDCLPGGSVPDDARIVVFHGLPRPHEVQEAWASALWR